MLTAKELWKNYHRMCDAYESCKDCPACMHHDHNIILCDDTEKIDEFIEVVEKWAKDNPIITNMMKFKEVFGFDYRYKTSDECGAYTKNCKYINTKLMCDTCPWWDEPYKEVIK